MKNDLLIKVVLAIIAGICGLLVSLGSYTFAQTVNAMDRRLQAVEHKANETATIRTEGFQRLARVEGSIESISKSVEEIKQDARKRDDKLDKILDKVTEGGAAR